MEALSADAVLEAATHINYSEVMPVQSPMLWFRNNPVGAKRKIVKSTAAFTALATINSLAVPSSEELAKRLMAVKSVRFK